MTPTIKAFEFLSHTADAGITANGATAAELFANAARGMFAFLGCGKTTGETFRGVVEARGIDRETLLVAWLSELLYLSGKERVCFEDFDIRELSETALAAEVGGRRIAPNSHAEREIKAVTYHALAIRKTRSGFTAKIIFDV